MAKKTIKSKAIIKKGCYLNDGWENTLLTSPNLLSSKWMIETIFRFLIAKSYFETIEKGKNKILDIGCSDGAFLQIYEKLARGPSNKKLKYLGVDMRGEALDKLQEYVKNNFNENVQKRIRTENINFIDKKQVIALKKKYKQFDCILALEIIEHVERDKGVIFIDNCSTMLADRGSLILSTPIHQKAGEELYYPCSHPYEYEYDELKHMLNDKFEIVQMLSGRTKANLLKNELKHHPEVYKFYKQLIKSTKQGSWINSLFATQFPRISENIIFICKKRI